MTYRRVRLDNKYLSKDPTVFGTYVNLVVNDTGNLVVAVVVDEQSAIDIVNALNAPAS